MIKRQYKLFKSVDDKIALTVLYNRENYKILTTFMMTEVHDFYPDVREALENVISRNMKNPLLMVIYWGSKLEKI